MMKIHSIEYADLVVGLINKLVEVFKMNAKVTVNGRQEMLERHLTFTELLFKGGVFFYTISTFGYFLYPLYHYHTFNEVIPLVPSYLPGVDENTQTGFIILTIFHLFIIIFGLFGSACIDFNFMMIIVNVPVLANILKDNISEQNEMLIKKKTMPVMIKAKLRNIFLLHREITE